MALLTILHFPDKRLHKVAKPVAAVTDRIRKLAADMAETMYDAPGVGLAATQIDVHERVVVTNNTDKLGASALAIEARINNTNPQRNKSLKPTRSPIAAIGMSVMATVRPYAFTIHTTEAAD